MTRTDPELETSAARKDTCAANGASELGGKPMKAIIGLAVLIAVSMLLYEVNHGRSDTGPPQTIAQRPQAPAH